MHNPETATHNSKIQDILTALHLSATLQGGSCGKNTWFKTRDAGQTVSINPASGEAIASVFHASAEDYATLIAAAQKCALDWRMVPAPKRGNIIREIGNALRMKKQALGQLVSLETGKSLQEGLGEVQEMIDMADFAAGQARQLYGLAMHSERSEHRMYEQWQPLGVTGIITAFNFPVAVWAWNAFVAVICGNTVVWKPSPKAPLCALAIQHLCEEVLAKHDDLPQTGLFSVFVTDDIPLAEKFVDDRQVALVSFTGSTPVGKAVAQRVADRSGKVLLELGGNNAIIVDETADLKLAVPAIVFGATGTAGQRCTTTRRLFIQESIYDTLVSALVKAYGQITIGDPLNEKNLMGPLIDAVAVSHYESAIAAAKKAGGQILFGGKKLERRGFFVEPTLVAAENHFAIVQQETFAPILYVMKYNTLQDAIAMQNQAAHGLSSALFTTHIKNAECFLSARGSDCGIANINIGTSGAEIGGAFGGEKATGGGREAGSDAWKAYMRRQTVTINWSNELPLAQGIKFDIA